MFNLRKGLDPSWITQATWALDRVIHSSSNWSTDQPHCAFGGRHSDATEFSHRGRYGRFESAPNGDGYDSLYQILGEKTRVIFHYCMKLIQVEGVLMREMKLFNSNTKWHTSTIHDPRTFTLGQRC